MIILGLNCIRVVHERRQALTDYFFQLFTYLVIYIDLSFFKPHSYFMAFKRLKGEIGSIFLRV